MRMKNTTTTPHAPSSTPTPDFLSWNPGTGYPRLRDRRPPRAVVHAGPMLLAKDATGSRLESYLEHGSNREMVLVHHGQPVLKQIAREAGVTGVRLDADARVAEDEEIAAADMAIALGAEQLEFAIDKPNLTNESGRPIHEMTLYEARALAADDHLPLRLRAKLDAGCSALERGLRFFRIGSPNALDRDRATVVFPDPPIAFGAELAEPESHDDSDAVARGNVRDEFAQEEKLAPLEPRYVDRRKRRRLRFSPRHGCAVGPRAADPFPAYPGLEPTSPRRNRRPRRRVARRA